MDSSACCSPARQQGDKSSAKLVSVFVVMRGGYDGARGVGESALGVLKLDGAVMNVEIAEQLIHALEDGITLRWRHVFDQHVTTRSEEHTSELQSPCNLVCRLL